MKFIANLTFLAAIAFLASVNTLEVSSPSDDYFHLSQIELQRALDKVQRKVESADLRGGDIINYLDWNAENLLQKVQNFDDSLVPLQALSTRRKYCVQNYKTELLSYSVVQKELTVCRTAAQTRVTSLTSTAKSYATTANTHTNTNLPNAMAACEKTSAGNQEKLEACVLERVDYFTGQVQIYLNAADKNLLATICTLNDLMRDALICTSKTVERTLVIIGRVQTAINACVSDVQTTCPCGKPSSVSLIKEIAAEQDDQDEE